MIEASDGSFYGTALEGGAQNGGTIFRIDRAGVVTVMHSFDFQTSGVLPRAELIQAEDGAFYGTTEAGGAGGCGTVFRMDPNGAVTVLHAFDRATGAYPYAPLVQAQDGFLYGTASEGGRYGAGVVFRVRLPRGVTLASPNGGETLVAGVATTLRWTATGTPTAFDLELSRDAGHTFEPIAGCAGLAGPARSCDWTPDGPSTRRAILRVTARYGVVRVTDQSDARFVISAAPPRKKAAVPQAHAPRPIGDFVVDRGRKDRIE